MGHYSSFSFLAQSRGGGQFRSGASSLGRERYCRRPYLRMAELICSVDRYKFASFYDGTY